MKKDDWIAVVSLLVLLVLCAIMLGKPQLLQEPKSCVVLFCFMFFYACVVGIINFVGYRKVLASTSSEMEKVHMQGLSDVALITIVGSVTAVGALLWYCYQHGLTEESLNRALMWLEVLELPVLMVILLICFKVHGFGGKVHTILKEKLNPEIAKIYWGFWGLTVVVELIVNVNMSLINI